jgi:adenylate cyclase
MPELLAEGPEPSNQWKYTLTGQAVKLGRKAPESDWTCPWDGRISRFHATLAWREGKLRVQREPKSTNPIYWRGQVSDDFEITVGEQFVIGATTFTLQEQDLSHVIPELPTPLNELTCSRQELEEVPYTEAEERIKVLSALPSMIRTSSSDQQLEQQVLEAVLQGIPRALTAAVVRLDPDSPTDNPEVQVRCAVDRHGGSPQFQPSRRLLADALRRRRQSVMHRWGSGLSPDSGFKTIGAGNWALCAPLPDEPTPGYALYVSGKIYDDPLLSGRQDDVYKSDLKFAELVADVFGALRSVRDLQSRQTLLTQFFSPSVRQAFAQQQDIDKVLMPREAEVTVLFCDLRGSCRIAEDAESDLAATCERVGDALTVMTNNIIKMDGVIGDFQGDAAMGFWGWPFVMEDQVEKASRAALGIYQDFVRESKRTGKALTGFMCGLGIASGQAIAGRLGSADQLKVSVFGPVVNLASRLEGMTKFFKVPILLDDRTAAKLAHPKATWKCRYRRLAQVQPYGMRKQLVVSELLPPAGEPGAMSDHQLRDYEAAMEAFQGGRWEDAQRLLDRLRNDGPASVLREFMARHNGKPPADWKDKAVITMDSK